MQSNCSSEIGEGGPGGAGGAGGVGGKGGDGANGISQNVYFGTGDTLTADKHQMAEMVQEDKVAPEVEVEEDKHVHSVTMALEMVALEEAAAAKAAKAVRADTEEETRSLFSLTSTGRAVQ